MTDVPNDYSIKLFSPIDILTNIKPFSICMYVKQMDILPTKDKRKS